MCQNVLISSWLICEEGKKWSYALHTGMKRSCLDIMYFFGSGSDIQEILTVTACLLADPSWHWSQACPRAVHHSPWGITISLNVLDSALSCEIVRSLLEVVDLLLDSYKALASLPEQNHLKILKGLDLLPRASIRLGPCLVFVSPALKA